MGGQAFDALIKLFIHYVPGLNQMCFQPFYRYSCKKFFENSPIKLLKAHMDTLIKSTHKEKKINV